MTDEPDVESGLVLTLDRLLDYITATPGTVRLAIETKHPTRHTRKVEEALVDLPRAVRAACATARRSEWAGKPAVRMMSFSQLAVRRMGDLAPGIPTVQLIGKRLRPLRREVLLGSATAVGPASRCIRADPTSSPTRTPPARRCTSGRSTAPADMELVRDLGVDVIITDHPGELLRRLGRAIRVVGPAADSLRSAHRGGQSHATGSCAESPGTQSTARTAGQARSVSSRAATRSPGVS